MGRDGGGYPDADFVLYVTAAESRICTGAVLAYASTCVRDQFDRPIFGHANFCPSKLSAAPAAMEEQLSTAVHEVLHALGFSSASWPLFRDNDGTPRTPRNVAGNVPLQSYTCPDGTAGSFRVPSEGTIKVSLTLTLTLTRTRTLALARTRTRTLTLTLTLTLARTLTLTIKVSTERGVGVAKMVTPRVTAVGRDLFGCDTLEGVELENQPTSASCFGAPNGYLTLTLNPNTLALTP